MGGKTEIVDMTACYVVTIVTVENIKLENYVGYLQIGPPASDHITRLVSPHEEVETSLAHPYLSWIEQRTSKSCAAGSNSAWTLFPCYNATPHKCRWLNRGY